MGEREGEEEERACVAVIRPGEEEGERGGEGRREEGRGGEGRGGERGN